MCNCAKLFYRCYKNKEAIKVYFKIKYTSILVMKVE